MKKLRVLLLALLLCGCSRIGVSTTTEEEEESKNYVVNCTSDSNETYTFFAKDDEIYSMQEVFYMSYEDAGVSSDMDAEEIKTRMNTNLSEKYSSIEGVSVKVDEVVDNQIKVIYMIDFDKADMDQLIDEGIIDKGDVDNQYVSLEKTKKAYTSNGYACEAQ